LWCCHQGQHILPRLLHSFIQHSINPYMVKAPMDIEIVNMSKQDLILHHNCAMS
jgi:hypothetical protein